MAELPHGLLRDLLEVDAPQVIDQRYLFAHTVAAGDRWLPLIVHRAVCPPLDDPGLGDWLRTEFECARIGRDDGSARHLVPWPDGRGRRVWVKRVWFADPELVVIDPATRPES